MRVILRLGFIAWLTSLAGCSGNTGISVETRAPADLAARITSLRFYVGQDKVKGDKYFFDSSPLDRIFLDRSRDISSDPYSLLIRPKTIEDKVVVAVLAYDGDQPIGFGRVDGVVGFVPGKVLAWKIEVIDLAEDEVIETDSGCLKWIDESGDTVHIGIPGDADCDGFSGDDDCTDKDPEINPGQDEICGNNVDDDCDDTTDGEVSIDEDGDGYYANCVRPEYGLDCDDAPGREDVYPGASELCDGRDNDCDGECDEDFDDDTDGYTTCGSVIDGDTGMCDSVRGPPDCDDDNEDIYPGAPELCDGQDNDCNRHCDEDLVLDSDEDGYTNCNTLVNSCGTGMQSYFEDCDEHNDEVYPGALELCDDVDNDCWDFGDGATNNENSVCAFKDPRDNVCRLGKVSCSNGHVTGICVTDTAKPSVNPHFCRAYDGCLNDDPLYCLIHPASASISQFWTDVNCTVNIVGGEQCSGNTVVVPRDHGPIVVSSATVLAAPTCGFTIVGGRLQQGYDIRLVRKNGDVVTGEGSCNVALKVSPIDLGAGAIESAVVPINVAFRRSSSLAPVQKVYFLNIGAHRPLECGSSAGLSCTTSGWNTIQPADLPAQ